MNIPVKLKFHTKLMEKLKPVYRMLGDLESWLLREELNSIKINAPIFVCSLPRSGTTIISEILSKHNDSFFHCYHDFPNIFMPYWKRWLKQRNPVVSRRVSERSHSDRIMVNQESIEAFEEVLWCCFNPGIHGNGVAKRIRERHSEKFIDFYIDHIKKLQLISGKRRYLCKNNYNINRLKDILDLFPEAKFIVPIRHPVNHVYSLEKQHQLFLKAGMQNPSIDKQLAASGHYEFGQLREIVSFGNIKEEISLIEKLHKGVTGWAHYWVYFYQQILHSLNHSKQLQKAVLLVNYDTLCQSSETVLEEIFDHLGLSHSNHSIIKSEYSSKLSQPKYYRNDLTANQIKEIMQITKSVADKFGYNLQNII